MDKFPWKYVIFYVFYYNGRQYTGNNIISRRIPLNSADEFREMEVFVRRDIQKKEYFYGIGLVVTGFALLQKPSLWTRAKLLFCGK